MCYPYPRPRSIVLVHYTVSKNIQFYMITHKTNVLIQTSHKPLAMWDFD